MNHTVLEIFGWIPALILTLGAFFQLIKLIKVKCSNGVSPLSWLLFGVANVCLYFYTQKYFELASIFGLLFAGIIDFTIAFMAKYVYKTTSI